MHRTPMIVALVLSAAAAANGIAVRRVHITNPKNYLQLSQVAVYDTAGTNVAVGKPCTASTGWNFGHGRSECGWALDGTLATRGGSERYYHSEHSSGWWEVDFGADVDVDRIVVYNRKDCCADRLGTASLLAISNAGRIVYETGIGAGAVQTIRPAGHKGCYVDSSNRDLPHRGPRSGGMTHEVCNNYCSGHGYQYFGVQHGDECWCGNSYGKYGGARDGRCNMKCPGNADQTCGGAWGNNVYSVRGTSVPPPTPVSTTRVTNLNQVWGDVTGCTSTSTIGECSTDHSYVFVAGGKYLTASASSSSVTMQGSISECSKWRFVRASDVHVVGETPFSHFIYNECSGKAKMMMMPNDNQAVTTAQAFELLELIYFADEQWRVVKKVNKWKEETTCSWCNNDNNACCSAVESFFGCKCYKISHFSGIAEHYTYVTVEGTSVIARTGSHTDFDLRQVQ